MTNENGEKWNGRMDGVITLRRPEEREVDNMKL